MSNWYKSIIKLYFLYQNNIDNTNINDNLNIQKLKLMRRLIQFFNLNNYLFVYILDIISIFFLLQSNNYSTKKYTLYFT